MKTIYHKIIERFGRETQINKIQEEALELALAINQSKCPTKQNKDWEAAIISEIADMKIMLAQAEILYSKERIDAVVKMKLEKVETKYLS